MKESEDWANVNKDNLVPNLSSKSKKLLN